MPRINELLAAQEVADDDVLPIWDTGARATRQMSASKFKAYVAGDIVSRYYGALASDPATRIDGSASQVGDRYFNTTDNVEKTFDGDSWFVPNVDAAALAAPGGAGLVGTSSGDTVQASLNALSLADYTALRAYAGGQKSVYLTGYLVSAAPSGIAGTFTRDDSDTTSADNGGTVLVAANGKRWKRVFDGEGSVKWFGVVGDGVTDNYAAITAAISALKNLYLPVGVYLTSQTIDWGVATVVGSGAAWNGYTGSATIIRGTTLGMLVCKNGYSLTDMVIDGNYTSAWGAILPSHCHNLDVVRATEYGAVCNSQQNGCYVNLRTWKSKHNLVLANGTRNCNFYNWRASVEEGGIAGGPAPADSSLLLLLIDTSNPRGFGLTNAVTGGGNDRNNFYGGIAETFTPSVLYAIRTANPSAYSGGNRAGRNNFYGYEWDGNSILLTDSTFDGMFDFHDCAFFTTTQNAAFSSGTKGVVNFYGNTQFSGGGNLSLRGVTQATNLLRSLYARTSELVEAVSGQQYDSAAVGIDGGAASFTFDAATKAFTVSGASASFQGLSVGLVGPMTRGNVVVAGVTVRAVRPVVRVTFSVDAVTGGTGQILFQVTKNASPFRATIATIGVGTYEYYYRMGADDDAFSWGQNGSTSYVISNIRMEIM